MTQINLKTTLYLVLLAALGAVWPWTSADAACGELTVSIQFSSAPTINCTTVFTCPSGTNCQSSSPPLVVTTASLTCTRPVGTTTRTCTDPPSSGTINYDPPQNSFTSSIDFPGFLSSSTPRGNCNCTTITLNADKSARATGCRSSGSNLPPLINQVFPPIGGGLISNFDGTYTIETPDSPNCPP
jgi:hypothetical protein